MKYYSHLQLDSVRPGFPQRGFFQVASPVGQKYADD